MIILVEPRIFIKVLSIIFYYFFSVFRLVLNSNWSYRPNEFAFYSQNFKCHRWAHLLTSTLISCMLTHPYSISNIFNVYCIENNLISISGKLLFGRNRVIRCYLLIPYKLCKSRISYIIWTFLCINYSLTTMGSS